LRAAALLAAVGFVAGFFAAGDLRADAPRPVGTAAADDEFACSVRNDS
jgi:hypothetical protein